MGKFHTELTLILTQGSFDMYSVRRIAKEISNDCGDFILHPAPLHFLPGETKILEWELAAFPAGAFKCELLKRPNSAYLSFDQETVFPDERFRIMAECGSKLETAEVFCNGNKIPFRIEGNSVLVEHAPEKTGEHKFEFRINGRSFHANGFVSEDLETVVDHRVRFIISKQQMTDPRSLLYGAYLIYDCEEYAPYFNYANANHNVCRERFGMGLLIAHRLQRKHNDEIGKSLKLFEQFLLREAFDTETGEVCNDIGKNAKYKRFYNTPWLITFWLEMHRLYKDDRFLVWIERPMRNYYGKGGATFYSNGSVFPDAIKAIRDAGKAEMAHELAGLVRTHVENIRANGVLYLPHEVRFEQTIVTPALSILSTYYDLIEHDPAQLDEAKKTRRNSEAFQRGPVRPQMELSADPLLGWLLVRQTDALRRNASLLEQSFRLCFLPSYAGNRRQCTPHAGEKDSAQSAVSVLPGRHGFLRLSASVFGNHAESG